MLEWELQLAELDELVSELEMQLEPKPGAELSLALELKVL